MVTQTYYERVNGLWTLNNLEVREDAQDDKDALATVDRWLVDGVDGPSITVQEAIEQQRWGDYARALFRDAWIRETGMFYGSGPIERGRGWRVWYRNGSSLDSKTSNWETIPEQFVLGVSYDGERRWMAQGRDPFWLRDGLLHDSRVEQPGPGRQVEGVYVMDSEMQHLRLLATLAFIL